MFERRLRPRSRVYYGGMVAFNARGSTLACVVRNFSQHGARIEFENSAAIPEQVDFADYKDVDGLKLPFTIRVSAVDPNYSVVRKFTEIKLNVPLDAKIFNKPA